MSKPQIVYTIKDKQKIIFHKRHRVSTAQELLACLVDRNVIDKISPILPELTFIEHYVAKHITVAISYEINLNLNVINSRTKVLDKSFELRIRLETFSAIDVVERIREDLWHLLAWQQAYDTYYVPVASDPFSNRLKVKQANKRATRSVPKYELDVATAWKRFDHNSNIIIAKPVELENDIKERLVDTTTSIDDKMYTITLYGRDNNPTSLDTYDNIKRLLTYVDKAYERAALLIGKAHAMDIELHIKGRKHRTRSGDYLHNYGVRPRLRLWLTNTGDVEIWRPIERLKYVLDHEFGHMIHAYVYIESNETYRTRNGNKRQKWGTAKEERFAERFAFLCGHSNVVHKMAHRYMAEVDNLFDQHEDIFQTISTQRNYMAYALSESVCDLLAKADDKVLQGYTQGELLRIMNDTVRLTLANNSTLRNKDSKSRTKRIMKSK